MSLYGLRIQPFNQVLRYLIWIFTHVKLCLADVMRLKNIQIWRNESERFWNLSDWCYVLSPTFWKLICNVPVKNEKNGFNRNWQLKG